MSTIIKRSSTPIAKRVEEVWKTLDAGFLDIASWAGGVSSSVANPETPNGVDGSQYGGRVCDVQGVGLTDERIVAFDAAAHSLTYTVAAPKLPSFVASLQNTWTVRPDGQNSVVDVEIKAVTKGVLGAIGGIPLGRMLGKGSVGLPNDLKKHLERC